MSLLGRLSYQLCFKPWGAIRRTVSRGLLAPWRSRQFVRAAPLALEDFLRRNPPTEYNQPPVPVVFFGGIASISLFSYSVLSLLKHTDRPLRLILLPDRDNTPDPRDAWSEWPHMRERIERVPAQHLKELLEEQLPRDQFPTLRRLRDQQIMMRKFIDPHLFLPGKKIYVDTDTAFLKEPIALFSAFDRNECCFQLDNEFSYALPSATLTNLTGHDIPQPANAGLFVMPAGRVNWNESEAWAAAILNERGKQGLPEIDYFFEQTLHGLNFAKYPSGYALPPEDYVLHPRRDLVRHQSGIFHHYVMESRDSFYSYGWQSLCKPKR